MKEKPDALQGTLALMVLKTLDVLGPQHGYGIARRIEQISGDILALNQGTLYPLLLKLEHEGSIVRNGAHRRTTAAPASIALP
jgi:PadR family transcriptional regulator, regulatory protein PadR